MLELDHPSIGTANVSYVAGLFETWQKDPAGVDPSWQKFFHQMQETAAADARPFERGDVVASLQALALIRSYRVRGHLIAQFDPLGLVGQEPHSELDPASYGFTDEDLPREIFIGGHLGRDRATLQEILRLLKEAYCGAVGVEYMHIQSPAEKAWICARVEGGDHRADLTLEAQDALLDHLTEAEALEQFLDRKYRGTKRFGLEGGESLIPALEALISQAAGLGVEEVVIGMAHRGRLNVLANILKKPLSQLFTEFQGGIAYPRAVQGGGDVKYHLGASARRDFKGRSLRLSLTPNPSHLEAVNPVVMGRVRAKQEQRGDRTRRRVMGLLIHGDAAFAGQGVVAETLTLSRLKGYRTGGTLHIIINNQIGFTTSPAYSRSSPYPSDVAKMVQAPIFHVNGDDPEAVVQVARLAAEFRQKFKRDVVMDLFCYRRHGHNEADEPAFTQPKMYQAIRGRATTREFYAETLARKGILPAEAAEGKKAAVWVGYEKAFEASKDPCQVEPNWLKERWSAVRVFHGDEELLPGLPGVAPERLQEVAAAITRVPEGFRPNSKIPRQLAQRREMYLGDQGIDWAGAEALAFGSLLAEGTSIRLSGQDSGRGTFSQRHAVLVDQESETKYIPVAELAAKGASFEVVDSPLSEASVLGFEYGYSLTEPEALVLWEAQFGDFANGAQVIIDQFLAGGESKWFRLSGLVLLLPHGFEGQGPEHSSARVERYLQLAAEENIQVVNCTTPANYFHVLRRQVRRDLRKPLVIMTPKSLLRDKRARSPLTDFGLEGAFNRVIPEPTNTQTAAAATKVRRVIFSSGKVYYDLAARRQALGLDDVALVRVEQLYPWPRNAVAAEVARYPNAEVVWCQEEPANMGAWYFVLPRFLWILQDLDHRQRVPGFAGRVAAASPASGYAQVHGEQQDALVEAALTRDLTALDRPFSRAASWPPPA